MFGGEAFGAQALDATGDELAPAVFQLGTDIDDLCLDPEVTGQEICGVCS